MTTEISKEVKIWDLFVRILHWSVSATFFIAYVTEDDFLLLHVWVGYVMAALVVMRVVWGFVGPEHARFRDFIFKPFIVWKYLGDLISFRDVPPSRRSMLKQRIFDTLSV